ncbi:MAG: ABC-type transport system, involved in lipoprotein release, permease component [Paenibacillaceae bacterium]|jgi:putative ABC transport system permease protein|nr:ABC-type transport system, involved in lipoprotein release, permease component [Paenibacillaceae bacterium]
MKKAFFVNLWRDIKKSLSRYLSIVVIIMVGVAFYVGVRATSPDMQMSGDSYFANHNLMDLKVISSQGLTESDIAKIRKQQGVTAAEGSYSLDAVIEHEQRQSVLNIHSLPGDNGMNTIAIVQGRRAEAAREAVVEDRFFEEYGLKLGDIISLQPGNDRPLEDSLAHISFEIVGTAESPLYVSDQRQSSGAGNGIVRGFVYVLPEAFTSEAYTEAYVRTDSTFSRNSLLAHDGYVRYTESVKEELQKLGEANWYVLGRTENAGYETYRQDSERIDKIGKAFPLIFFLVAALVSLTTMTRMVQEKRIELGIFKALGYSRTAIVAHYLIYSLSASAIGSVIGMLIGFRLFPPLLMDAYNARYTIADKLSPFHGDLALTASTLAVLFTAAAAAAATLGELREVPASLMRPKPPKSGRRILLERSAFIWKRLNFSNKVTARNMFRYKQRLFMTVVGIAACTGLITTGFGLKEGIIGATEAQFSSVYLFDMQGTLAGGVDEAGKNGMKEQAAKDSNVKSILFAYSRNASAQAEDHSEAQDAYVVVPENTGEFNRFVKLSMNGKEFELDEEGVVITRKLSRLLDKQAGDRMEIVLDNKVIPVSISGVTEHYIQHYIYISPAYFRELTGSGISYNYFYGLLHDTSEAAENAARNALKSMSGVNFVEFKSDAQINYDKGVEGINSVVPVLILSAGVLAFVVIYNLTNINIAERRRELATIKLLGFYNHELAAYIYRENIILTVIGGLAGIPAGMLLNKVVIATAETNAIMFMEKISPVYFLISVMLALLFSAIVNAAMYKRFDKIDMIESLKSAE